MISRYIRIGWLGDDFLKSSHCRAARGAPLYGGVNRRHFAALRESWTAGRTYAPLSSRDSALTHPTVETRAEDERLSATNQRRLFLVSSSNYVIAMKAANRRFATLIIDYRLALITPAMRRRDGALAVDVIQWSIVGRCCTEFNLYN